MTISFSLEESTNGAFHVLAEHRGANRDDTLATLERAIQLIAGGKMLRWRKRPVVLPDSVAPYVAFARFVLKDEPGEWLDMPLPEDASLGFGLAPWAK